MAFGRKKKDPEPAVEEGKIFEVEEPEKEWPVGVLTNQQGGEPNMAEQEVTFGEPNGEQAKRTRILVTDHLVDEATAAAFESVRAKIGPGTSIRTVTDHFYGYPSRLVTTWPDPPPVEKYSAKEIAKIVGAKLAAGLAE